VPSPQYATGTLKAGINPKVVSERIGHANVGFFLQTYAVAWCEPTTATPPSRQRPLDRRQLGLQRTRQLTI
jgi:hypothetical protein